MILMIEYIISRSYKLGLILVVCMVCIQDIYAANKFKVFDATLYRSDLNLRDYGIPLASKYGIETLEVMYEGDIWPNMRHLKNDPPNGKLVTDSIRRVKKKFEPFKINIVCLDIEHWSLKENGYVLDANKKKFIQTIDAFKQGMPGIKFGFYSMLPVRNYYDALKDEQSIKYKSWQSQNDKLNDIARHVDIIFPSLYTFGINQSDWARYAVANIKEAKRYGKKVYAFIWPQYHNSVHIIGGNYLSEEYFELQLKTVYEHADGVVIWGGWATNWDEDAGWWIALKKFMGEINK